MEKKNLKYLYQRCRTFGTWVISLFVLLSTISCEHEDIVLYQQQEENRTISGFIGNNFDFTLLYEALKYTGLYDTLNNHLGEYTLLAPRNVAFNNLGIYTADDIRALDQDSLYWSLRHHILPRRLKSEDIVETAGIRYATLANQEVETTRNNFQATAAASPVSYIWFSGSLASRLDLEYTNGIVHALDRIIKYYPKGTVADFLEDHDEYSIFAMALRHFGRMDMLRDLTRRFTVYAPRNVHFEHWGIDADSILRMDVNKYDAALLFGSYIMQDREVYTCDLAYAFMNGQYFVSYPLKEPAGYNLNMTMGPYYPSIPTLAVALSGAYSLVVAQHRYPLRYRESTTNPYLYADNTFLGSRTVASDPPNSITSGMQGGTVYMRMDHKTTNGVLHDFRALLVMPYQAEK